MLGKRTPGKPGRGPVATGPQPAASTDGDDVRAAGNGAGEGGANGRTGEQPAVPPARTDGDAPVDAGSGVTGSDIVAAEASGAEGAAGDGAVVDGARSESAEPAAPPDEVTTTQMRVPAPSAAAPDGVATADGSSATTDPAPDPSAGPAADGDAAATATTPSASATDTVRIPAPAAAGSSVNGAGTKKGDKAATPTLTAVEPVEPTLDPVPAPAVPAPGPGAAQPPPWRRVSDRDGRVDGGAPAPAMERLIDEGPTAFLEPPRPDAASQGVSDPAPSETGSWARIPRSRPPRQAALQLKRLDPWSVLKLALVLAVVLFFIWLVAVGVLYGVLDGMGVWDRLNGTYADLVSGEAGSGSALISAGRVFGLAAVVGAINSLLFAVAVTVGAFVYNVSADLVGGVEVTLSERDGGMPGPPRGVGVR